MIVAAGTLYVLAVLAPRVVNNEGTTAGELEEEPVSEGKRPPGRPPIGPAITAAVEPDLLEILRARAAERDTSLAAAVRDVLRRGLEADQEERATA